jgi:hypothetical protein
LTEGVAKEFEIGEGENLLMKISLKNKLPPLTLSIKYLNNNNDLALFLSETIKEPNK